MRVLVTGATGFLGFRLLERLSEDPRIASVVAVGRVIKPEHFVDHPKINYVLGDLDDDDFVGEIVQGIDTIVHAAALSSHWAKREAFYTANVAVQKKLIRAAKVYEVQRIVYVSSANVYVELKDKLNVKESDPLPTQFIDDYARTKREAEILLENSGLDYIILRLRGLIGRGDTVIMPRLIRASKEGKLRIIGRGNNVADLTAVANAAEAIVLSLFAQEQAVGQVYNISNGGSERLWEKVIYLLNELGLEPPRKRVPFWLGKNMAQFLELKSRLTDMKEPVLTQSGVGSLAKSFTLDISKARRLLGYEPKVSMDEAAEEFIEWYRGEGAILNL